MNQGDPATKKVSLAVAVGLALALVGVFVTVLSLMVASVIGVVVGIFLIPVGLVVLVVGMGKGWGLAFGDNSKRPIERATHVYVIAKLAVDANGDTVFDLDIYAPDELKFLVQIRFSNGSSREFETSQEVFANVGEGMVGEIVYQGRWLSQFTWRPKSGGTEIGEDPFRAGKL